MSGTSVDVGRRATGLLLVGGAFLLLFVPHCGAESASPGFPEDECRRDSDCISGHRCIAIRTPKADGGPVHGPLDATLPSDATTVRDAAKTADSGDIEDGGYPLRDAGPHVDAGRAPDGGRSTDAGKSRDAGRGTSDGGVGQSRAPLTASGPGYHLVCGPNCDSDLCAANHQLCTSLTGTCRPRTCADEGLDACPAESFCDPTSGCVSTVGLCPTGFCPTFGGKVTDGATVQCEGGACRARGIPVVAVGAPFFPDPRITVTEPLPERRFSSDPAVEFRWNATAAPVIALVLSGAPATKEDLLALSIWGAAVPNGGSRVLHWRDGHPLSGGRWLPGSPNPPPHDVPLYLLIEAVTPGDLQATSAIVPFQVGEPFKLPDDPCTDNGAYPGSCRNPDVLMGCFGKHCRVVCGSNLDCSDAATTFSTSEVTCGLPIDGFRLCE